MSMLKPGNATLDPFQFLRCLHNIVVKSGKQDFDLIQQRNASENMFYVFENLCR